MTAPRTFSRFTVAAFGACALAAMAASIGACSDGSGSVSGGVETYDATAVTPVPSPLVDAAVADVAPATFTEVYTQIIGGPPSCNECHVAPNPSAMLDMSDQATAYTSLVGKPATAFPACAAQTIKLVDPGNAAGSLLYQKVTNPPCGSQMPLAAAPLKADQTALIAGWINAGAKND